MEALGTFSEFALALAGFAAIALVLVQRGGTLPPGAIYVVRFMVVNALGPAMLALFALILVEAEVSEPLLWRICSGVYLAVAVFFGSLSLRQQGELQRSGDLLLSKTLYATFWTGAFVGHAIQLVNLIGFPAGPSMALFLAGLWMLLAVAAAQFVALLFVVLR